MAPVYRIIEAAEGVSRRFRRQTRVTTVAAIAMAQNLQIESSKYAHLRAGGGN